MKTSEISAVIQGPIVGTPRDPWKKRLTSRCIESIRKYLPGAEIILSTWKGSNATCLYYDTLIENEDPGAIRCHRNLNIFNNTNRQIVSTRSGLLQATRQHALKIRSDMILTGSSFLQYFGRYRKQNYQWKLLAERVLACTAHTANPRQFPPFPFAVCDWFFFGLKEDVLNIWDIPLAPEPETSRWFEQRSLGASSRLPDILYRFSPEQYIWLSFLRKYAEVPCDHFADINIQTIELTELSIANNLVLLTPGRLRFRFLKYEVDFNDSPEVFTHCEWLSLYKKYCDDSIKVPLDVAHIWKRLIYPQCRSLLNRLIHRSIRKLKRLSSVAIRLEDSDADPKP